MREVMRREILRVLVLEKTGLYIDRRCAETAGILGGREWREKKGG
jgi:hypothetical protein